MNCHWNISWWNVSYTSKFATIPFHLFKCQMVKWIELGSFSYWSYYLASSCSCVVLTFLQEDQITYSCCILAPFYLLEKKMIKSSTDWNIFIWGYNIYCHSYHGALVSLPLLSQLQRICNDSSERCYSRNRADFIALCWMFAWLLIYLFPDSSLATEDTIYTVFPISGRGKVSYNKTIWWAWWMIS